jgi:uncharacterized protein YjbI with pentapeptide repeats
MPDHRRTIAILLVVLLGSWPASGAEHLDADQVRAEVAAAHGRKIDLSGKDLSGDDLTGLDLSGANLVKTNLTNANLHGVKLVDADLTWARLVHADLTFAWFIRTNFTHADLHGATLKTVVTSTGLENTQAQASVFVGADLSDTHTTVHFSLDDMRGVSFSHADMTVVMANQSMGLLRTEFNDCELDGADFSGAGLGHVAFRFAKLRHANFRNADLRDADFVGAYLDGAVFTDARTEGADFESADLRDARGLRISASR